MCLVLLRQLVGIQTRVGVWIYELVSRARSGVVPSLRVVYLSVSVCRARSRSYTKIRSTLCYGTQAGSVRSETVETDRTAFFSFPYLANRSSVLVAVSKLGQLKQSHQSLQVERIAHVRNQFVCIRCARKSKSGGSCRPEVVITYERQLHCKRAFSIRNTRFRRQHAAMRFH